MAITSNGFNPTDSPCPLVLACALRLAFSIQLTLADTATAPARAPGHASRTPKR